MIDKIFPTFGVTHEENNYESCVKALAKLYSHLNQCKDRYKQYHPDVPRVHTSEEQIERTERFCEIFKEARITSELPPMTQPEAKPHTCPICLGDGKIKRPIKTDCAVFAADFVCHGCKGKGWVIC